jgi:Fe-S cluster assembly iron-binding protein IscA
MEFRITQLAEAKIKETVELNNEVPVLRIYVEKAACSGARFGIAFDDIKEGDEVTEVNGIRFITDTDYVPQYANGISIDYACGPKEGFMIQTLFPIIKSGGGCGGGCSGCSH